MINEPNNKRRSTGDINQTTNNDTGEICDDVTHYSTVGNLEAGALVKARQGPNICSILSTVLYQSLVKKFWDAFGPSVHARTG